MHVQQLSADLFEPLIGHTFAVTLKDGTVPLVLRSVTRLPPPRRLAAGAPAPADGNWRADPFTLLFGGATHLLPQRTYALTTAALGGAIDVFIVPVGRDAQGFIYEAVFG